MKFVMTQAVCPEGMQLLDGIADVYVADNQDPNNYLDEMRDAAALIVRIAKCDANAIENSPKVNWKIKFQSIHPKNWNLVLQNIS